MMSITERMRIRGLCILAGLLAGQPAAALAAEPTQGWRVIDDVGRTLVLAHPARRVISLAPASTAMIFAAGGGAQVVGTAEFSVEPEAARRIARIGDAHGFDLERILKLHPDVVVAWSGGASAAQLAPLERAGLLVYRHQVARLDDLAPALLRLGVLLGTEGQARVAANALEMRIRALRRQYRTAMPRSLLIQVWDRPVYTVGGTQLISDVVAACGYRNLFADLLDPGPAVALEAVVERNPDAILVLAADAGSAREWLQHWQQLPALSAVHTHQLFAFVDARLSRLGPQVVDAAEELCRALRAGPAPQAY